MHAIFSASAVPPNIVPFTFGSDTIEAGEMAQLQCIVSSGDPPLQITWAFHGKDSSTMKQKGVSTVKFGERSSLLVIDSVNSEHVGTYTCFARNLAGNSSYSTELRVNGKDIWFRLYTVTLSCT